jgi:hypothetical protein
MPIWHLIFPFLPEPNLVVRSMGLDRFLLLFQFNSFRNFAGAPQSRAA